MRDISIHIQFVHAVLRYVQGRDRHYILRKSQIPPGLINKRHARVSVEQFARLQLAAVSILNDECLGYLNKPVPLGSSLSAWSWVLQSDNLEQAIRKLCRSYNIFQEEFHFELTKEGAVASLSMNKRFKRHYDPYIYEYFLFNVQRFCSWLIDESLRVSSVSVSYPEPQYKSEYRLMFFGQPVNFSTDQNILFFEREFLGKKIRQDQDTFKCFLGNPFKEFLLAHSMDDNLISRTKRILASDLKRTPQLPEVASQLRMNQKKFHRLLEGQNLTYMDIKNEVRRDEAIYYLTRHQMSIEEIAVETGFSEASSFIRAFKKWTGVTPHTYRKGRTGIKSL